ncbi:MAG: hypothetical protein M0Z51_12945 [Propionibacterium sp.]|nr:hypothetical protein [Propionibacterium sp.]
MSGASFIKYLAVVLVTLFAVLGGLFAAGYAVEDLSGPTVALVIAGYAVPAGILSVMALLRPVPTGPILIALSGAMILFNDIDALARLVPRDTWGPVGVVAVLMLSAAIGFLGVHRPTLAGWLLIALAAGQAVAALVFRPGDGGAVPVRAALSGSTGVVVVPLLVIGVLFLIAGRLSGAVAVTAPAH